MESVIDMVVNTGSDGFNGDTMCGVNRSFYEESLRRDHPVAIEPELWISDLENLSYNVMSWGYYTSMSGTVHNSLILP